MPRGTQLQLTRVLTARDRWMLQIPSLISHTGESTSLTSRFREYHLNNLTLCDSGNLVSSTLLLPSKSNDIYFWCSDKGSPFHFGSVNKCFSVLVLRSCATDDRDRGVNFQLNPRAWVTCSLGSTQSTAVRHVPLPRELVCIGNAW